VSELEVEKEDAQAEEADVPRGYVGVEVQSVVVAG